MFSVLSWFIWRKNWANSLGNPGDSGNLGFCSTVKNEGYLANAIGWVLDFSTELIGGRVTVLFNKEHGDGSWIGGFGTIDFFKAGDGL